MITNSIVCADRGVEFDLYNHPLFKQQAARTKSPSLDATEFSPQIRNSVNWIPQGTVSYLKSQFEERTEEKTPAPLASRQYPQAIPPQEQSWGSWVGSLVLSSFNSFLEDWGFGEDEEENSMPVSTAKIDNVNPEADKENSSYFTQSYNWTCDTVNWISDTLWGQPKKQPSVARVNLEEIKGFDTVKLPKELPKALGAVLEGGWNTQDPQVIETLATKLDEADAKYKSPANLSEARKRAPFVKEVKAEMDETWETFYPKLIRKTRTRTQIR